MSDLEKRLRFDANDVRNCHSSTIANRILDAAVLIENYERRIFDLEARLDGATAFSREIATQKPEKPDYWSSCGQCEHNIERAQDILEACAASPQAKPFEWPPLPAFPKPFLDSDKSGAMFTEHQMQGYANEYGEAIRALLQFDTKEGK